MESNLVIPETEKEYVENNENIFYCSIGSAIQNVQLTVPPNNLTSAWLLGGGEKQTNDDPSKLLGHPDCLRAYGTIPIGVPSKEVSYRYRRPLEQVTHWNAYEPSKFRSQKLLDFYHDQLRPFAMYRDKEDLDDWEDMEEKLGEWKEAFTTSVSNPDGKIEK